MFVSLLPVPFADAARQRQFDALEDALRAEADAPATVLLGNLGAWAEFEADALLVRPNCLALFVLTPRAGRLTVPALAYGSWQLDGQPLPGRDGSDNPFLLWQQQLPSAVAWLRAELGPLGEALPPCAGLALFEAPLTFGPEVEAHFTHGTAPDFQLVGGASQVPRRLRELAVLPAAAGAGPDILAWADQLTAELAAPWETADETLPTNYLTQKLQQLWRWLGAEDIPADPPYGDAPTPATHLRDQQEQARLQQLRHELQAELTHQRQEAAAREAARTQELAQLRQQLAQAGLSTTERRTEQQATAVLEEELRTARAELAARHQELDTRIQQLGLLIKQLQAQPQVPSQPAILSQPALGAAPTRPPVPSAPPAQRATAPKKSSFRRLRQAERWGVVALALAGVGVGTWGMVRLVQPPKARPAAPITHRRSTVSQVEEGAAPHLVYVVDSTLATPTKPDTTDANLYSVDAEPTAATAAPTPTQAPPKQAADSTAKPAASAPTPPAAPDSAAGPSPTP
jgi:hypothetical protein